MLVDSIGPASAILEEKDLPDEPESEEMHDDKDVQGGGEEEEEKMVEDNETGTDKEVCVLVFFQAKELVQILYMIKKNY